MAGEQSRLTPAQERQAREVLLAARRAAEELELILGTEMVVGWVGEVRTGELGYTEKEAAAALRRSAAGLKRQAERAHNAAERLWRALVSTTGHV